MEVLTDKEVEYYRQQPTRSEAVPYLCDTVDALRAQLAELEERKTSLCEQLVAVGIFLYSLHEQIDVFPVLGADSGDYEHIQEHAASLNKKIKDSVSTFPASAKALAEVVKAARYASEHFDLPRHSYSLQEFEAIKKINEALAKLDAARGKEE